MDDSKRQELIATQAGYAYRTHQGTPLAGWSPGIWEMRQRAALVVAVPCRGALDVEVYATSLRNAVDILMSYDLLDLRFAVRARGLQVPNGMRNKRGLAETLAIAGPAHFGDHG